MSQPASSKKKSRRASASKRRQQKEPSPPPEVEEQLPAVEVPAVWRSELTAREWAQLLVADHMMQVGTAPTEPTLSMMVWPHTAEVLQDGVPAEDAVGDQPEVAQLLLEAISRSTAHQPTTGSQAKLSIDRSLEESSPTCESPELPWIGEVRQLQQQMDAER